MSSQAGIWKIQVPVRKPEIACKWCSPNSKPDTVRPCTCSEACASQICPMAVEEFVAPAVPQFRAAA